MIAVQPYINFKGNCREAIEFYKQALGAEERQGPVDDPERHGRPQASLKKALGRLGGGNEAESPVAVEYLRKRLQHQRVGIGENEFDGVIHGF